ncbi:hypothetical protein KR018_004370, partial [Drosophila ironensis]
MDSKRAAHETGDGPPEKRTDPIDIEKASGEKLTGADAIRQIEALGKHIPPFTGNNGCAASLEAFMFQQTPAGSQLLPWPIAECQTSENDLELDKSTSNNNEQESAQSAKKGESSHSGLCGRGSNEVSRISLCVAADNSKLSRRELAKMRREHTLRALALERELTIKPGGGLPTVVLLIRFPDPEISAPMLTGLSKDIRDVVLPSSVAPRYCLVHLKPEADVEATIAHINATRFGSGYLQAEHKPFSDEEQAEFIDPCSLYVSNIPFNMTTSAIKAYFTRAMRVDIGVLKREKRARYAFVRYSSPEITMEAFKELVGSPLNSRTLTVRYRRLRKRPGIQTMQCTNSTVIITPPSAEDDNVDCKVISPPPAELITISDSDNCSDSSGEARARRRGKQSAQKETDHEREIQKLKRQMAEYGSIIKNLQVRQNIVVDPFLANLSPKEEPRENPSACIPVLGSNVVHLLRDIKKECAYLGIPNDTINPQPTQKPTTKRSKDGSVDAKGS